MLKSNCEGGNVDRWRSYITSLSVLWPLCDALVPGVRCLPNGLDLPSYEGKSSGKLTVNEVSHTWSITSSRAILKETVHNPYWWELHCNESPEKKVLYRDSAILIFISQPTIILEYKVNSTLSSYNGQKAKLF